MRRRALALAFVLLALGAIEVTRAETRLLLLCRSDEVSSAGYWATELGSSTYNKRGESLEKQKSVSEWRLDLRDDGTALVSKPGTSSPPEAWTVETDPAKSGMILVPHARHPGTSPEIITVTAKTLHFVYSSQHVNPLYNRANIWVGQCRKAP